MAVEYKRIKPKKINEAIADTLYEMIKSGELKPGDKLDSVQQLAENFQVGRSAVREALSALRAQGLIEMKQGEGTYVKVFDASKLDFTFSSAVLMNKTDVVHLLEVRKIIEIGAVGLAAENRTTENIKELQAILERMKDSCGNDDEEEKNDILFHLMIAKASQNPMLYKLMRNVSSMMSIHMKETRRIWLYSEGITDINLFSDHARILQAIIEKNKEMAQKLMWNHLTVVEKNLAAYYKNHKINR
ncbi:FadR/GntR family transcriptional regulator [Bacillus massiliigorillae]|uniref:FadR/GntR family transcriptional regulator n=1 Tax=Bacillus massiliigorillae TaxID=1243664 RepID=UPI0003A67F2C|nr:FadR/GntR family transcriptional regulator [Bacillus massiliigorillae]